MTNMNSVCLVGNVVRDIGEKDFGYVGGSNTARLNATIAVNRSRKQGDQWIDEPSYIDFVVWGKAAENLKQMLHKGVKIALNGYLKQDRWQDDSGNKKSRIYVVADTIDIMAGKHEDGGNPKPTYENSFNPRPQQNEPVQNGENGFAEDIPF